jgi:hypothetical protein
MLMLWSPTIPEPAKRKQREPVLPWLGSEDRPYKKPILGPEDAQHPEVSLKKPSEPNEPSRNETLRLGARQFRWRDELCAEVTIPSLATLHPDDEAATSCASPPRPPPRAPPLRPSRTDRWQRCVHGDADGLRVLPREQQTMRKAEEVPT